MEKIPFTLDVWLKDKSQKIETRNGRQVHYIGLDRAGWQVFEIFKKNGTSEYRTYHNSYMYCGPEESTYDLFIVTPEEEMTEWQRFISACLQKHGLLDCGAADRIAKESAAELLKIAEKQINSDGYLILHRCSFEDEIYHREKRASEKAEAEAKLRWYDKGVEDGKAEALKDLPRWKRSKPESGRNYVLMFKGGSVINTTDFREDGRFYYEDGESYCDIHYNDSCVMWMYLDELLQLPGFKEDESHE